MTRRVVILGAGVAGLTTAFALARGGIRVDVLESDRAQAPLGRRTAAGWVREGTPQAQHAHVFGPDFHRLLATELPDVLALLLEAGVRESPARSGPGSVLALRRPLLDWVLRRVAEREPGMRVHCGMPATGLRTDGSRLTGILVRGGLLETEVAVDATGIRTPIARWLSDLGYSCAHPAPSPPGPLLTTTYYSRGYALRWPSDTGASDSARAGGGAFDGYRCWAVPGDNDTFTVTFGIPGRQSDRSAGAPSALRTPEGFQAAAEHVSGISNWVDPGTADPLTGVAVLHGWPPASERGPVGFSALPGLVAVGDARGVSDPIAGNGVALAMAQGLACAAAVLGGSGAEDSLEQVVAGAGTASAEPGLPVPRRRSLAGPNVRELVLIAGSAGRSTQVSA